MESENRKKSQVKRRRRRSVEGSEWKFINYCTNYESRQKGDELMSRKFMKIYTKKKLPSRERAKNNTFSCLQSCVDVFNSFQQINHVRTWQPKTSRNGDKRHVRPEEKLHFRVFLREKFFFLNSISFHVLSTRV